MAPNPSETKQRGKFGPPSKFKPPRQVSTGKPTQKTRKTAPVDRQTPANSRAKARNHGRVPASSISSSPQSVELKSRAQSISEEDDDSINSGAVRSQDGQDGQDAQEDQDSASVHVSPEYSSSQTPLLIPPALLTKLFHHHFSNEKVRMGAEARSVAGKYVEVFVREAIARAAFERQEGVRCKEREGRRTVVGEGDFLEVEDLEKLAPQLLLDF